MKQLALLISIVTYSLSSYAQVYGNEWVDYTQSYYKFKLAENAVYRISHSDLSAAGIPINSIDPRNFELYKNGEPVNIFVSGEDDGKFDVSDFIEFYGKKNDGSLDAELYPNAADHTNPYVSLYSDSSVYFLTWKSTKSAHHITQYNDPNYVGKTPDTYFTYEVVQSFDEDYYAGVPAGTAEQMYSEYTKGEGYLTSRTRFMRKFEVNTPGKHAGSTNAQLEVSAFSRNNPEQFFNGSNHEAGVAVGTEANLLKSIQKNNQNFYFFPYTDLVFPTTLIGNTTDVYIGEVNNAQRPNSEISISYFKLKYDRLYDLANNSNLLFDCSTTNNYFEFSNYESGLQDPIIYDLTHGHRIVGKVTAGKLRFNTKEASPKTILISDETKVMSIGNISEARMNNYIAEGSDYLIVTNEALDSGANEYAKYRSSVAGGGFKVKVLFVQDLYDNFSYGYHHPLGVKRSIDYNLDKLSEPIENILLLGKGQMYDLVRFDDNRRNFLDLVPAIGSPPSDYLYVSSLNGSDVQLKTPIGRVSARSNQQISIYLEKIIEHEAIVSVPWQKHIIQISGGKTESENLKFQGYLNTYYSIARDSLLGAHRTIFAKSNTNTVSKELTEEIQETVNSGANIFTYFGHGSPQVLDLDIGPATTLENKGKYPLFVFNGCSLGNLYVQSSIGEEYLFTRNKGSIYWLASTGFGFSDPLSEYTKLLHKELLQLQYGESIGKSIQSTIQKYASRDILRIINSRQLAYHGDPALRIIAPSNPDFVTDRAVVSNKFSAVDGIVLEINMKNIGRTTSDSVQMTISAANSDSSAIIFDQYIAAPNYTKDLEVTIPNSSLFEGLTTFRITLDKDNKIIEIPGQGEINNIYEFQHLFELQKPLVIYPELNQIIATPECNFVFQISNHDNEAVEVEVDIDTSELFNSALKFTTTFTTKNNLIRKSISLPPLDGHDYYFRIRTKDNASTSDWVEGSFAYLFGSNPGWSEGHNFNFANASLNLLLWNKDSTQFDFGSTISNKYTINTHGGFTSGWRYFELDGLFDIIGARNYSGVEVVAFHPNTEERYNALTNSKFNLPYEERYFSQTPSDKFPEYYVVGQKCGIYNFDLTKNEDQDSFINYLQGIPNDYHIMIRNGIYTGIETWDSVIFQELNKFGFTFLNSVKENEPFALFGTKGKPESKKVLYADYNDTIIPPTEQKLSMAFNVFPKVKAGAITTETIGPSSKWFDAEVSVKNIDSPRDSFWYEIIGVRADKTDSTIFESQTANKLDISSINANNFPYLRIKLHLRDEQNLTPMFIDRWTVRFDGVTEGVVDLDERNYSNADTLTQGQVYVFETAFRNISKQLFDSCQVQTRLIKSTGETVYDSIRWIKSILPDEFILVNDTIETLEINGDFQLLMNVNHDKKVVENEYLNNLFYKNLHIKGDQRNPILDVVFDGFHILNKDIVSSNTLITITGSDEHPYLFLDDPELFTITLKFPGEDTARPVNTSDINVEFTPAGPNNKKAFMTYQAQDLPDGVYTLTASLMDRSNNNSGAQPYVIDFKVINKKSISNLYPYPNPFTTCAKFVFTCTGNEVPDQVLINIYTITGRLVKQIDETELGPIKIGNNVSEYCWDGTDTYGDKLANGVYLYKAEILSNGKRIDLFETSSDHLFNNGFGKLYIAR